MIPAPFRSATPPDYAEVYSNRGIAWRDQGDVDIAIQDFERYLNRGGGIRYSNQAEVEKCIK